MKSHLDSICEIDLHIILKLNSALRVVKLKSDTYNTYYFPKPRMRFLELFWTLLLKCQM